MCDSTFVCYDPTVRMPTKPKKVSSQPRKPGTLKRLRREIKQQKIRDSIRRVQFWQQRLEQVATQEDTPDIQMTDISQQENSMQSECDAACKLLELLMIKN